MQKKVLIFGKDGQLGYDLTRVFDRHYVIDSRSSAEVSQSGTKAEGVDYYLAALNRADIDITNSAAVCEVIKQQQPNIIINATAYNKVEAAEAEEQLATAINGEAVGSMAKAAKEVGAVFVHVSTDYVFDGSKDLFTEDDVPNPLNAYGRSKLAGEELVKAISSAYYLVRTSSVFGAKEGNQKKNFVDKMIDLAKAGQTIKVVRDQVMSPTYSFDLALKIKELLEKSALFGIYHITNQGSCSWYEFAEKALELMNINAALVPISTEESGTKVNRPKKSVLKNLALAQIGISPMPPWQDALERYLKEKYK